MLSPPSIPELTARLNALELRVAKQDIENAKLKALLSERDAYIVELKAEVIELNAKLNKNSSNSSVPPDNDAAERGIRGAKVKRNVSNQFRSKTGTEQYCIIRPVIATALLQGIGALDVLTTKKSLNFGQ